MLLAPFYFVVLRVGCFSDRPGTFGRFSPLWGVATLMVRDSLLDSGERPLRGGNLSLCRLRVGR